MKNVLMGVWRALRVFVACAIGVAIVLPSDRWFTKETLAVAIGAGIAGVFKFVREAYGIDIKVV